jgi:hypothetical protein
MADSGLIHENIPLLPLIQPERKLDVVIALDAVSHSTQSSHMTQLAVSNSCLNFHRVPTGKTKQIQPCLHVS